MTNKKANKKHHTLLSTAGARPTIPIILGMVIDFNRSVVLPLGAIENLWENAPTKGKSDQTKILKATIDAYKCRKFP